MFYILFVFIMFYILFVFIVLNFELLDLEICDSVFIFFIKISNTSLLRLEITFSATTNGIKTLPWLGVM